MKFSGQEVILKNAGGKLYDCPIQIKKTKNFGMKQIINQNKYDGKVPINFRFGIRL